MPNVYLPSFSMKLLRPAKNLARNKLVFECPRYLNKFDIKSYLSSVYGVQPVSVNTVVLARQRHLHRSPKNYHKHPNVKTFIWRTIYKRAFVTLNPEDVESFTFPPMPDHMAQRMEQKKEKLETIDKNRRRWSDILESDFDRVLDERYAGHAPPSEPMCESILVDELKRVSLDEASVVKRSVERRLKPETVKIARKEVTPRLVQRRRLEEGQKRREAHAEMLGILDKALNKVETAGSQ